MKKQLLTIVLATLCLNFEGKAQQSDTIMPLLIGDQVPNTFWDTPLKVLNGNQTNIGIKLNQYRNKKLIILDFWASWCSTCLKGIPKIDSLNLVYPNVHFLLVNAKKTGDDAKKVTAGLAKVQNKIANTLTVQTIFEDTTLARLFPHNIIPHYVWILDGRVIGMTDAYEVTRENIEALISGTKKNLVLKSDRTRFDYNESFYVSMKDVVDASLLQNSLLLKYTPGLISGGNTVQKDGKKRYFYTNTTAISLFQRAFNCSYNRLLVEDNLVSSFPSSPRELNTNDRDMEAYRKKFLFCYETIVPVATPEAMVHAKMLSDLNAYFGLKASRQLKKVSCYVISRNENLKVKNQVLTSIDSVKSIKTFKVTSVKDLLNVFNYYPSYLGPGLPVLVDETNYHQPIEMELPEAGLVQEKLFIRALNKYGFEVTKAEREIEMCVITD